MATNENLIPIPGRLHSVASDKTVSGADEIYDDELQIFLNDINKDINSTKTKVTEIERIIGSEDTSEDTIINRINNLELSVEEGGSVDQRISNAVNVEKNRAEGIEGGLRTQINGKQRTLSVGSGITLTSDGVISATADPSVGKVVESLPLTDIIDGMIYLVQKANTPGTYVQWVHYGNDWTNKGEISLDITTDDTLDSTSSNPIQNAAIAAQIGYFVCGNSYASSETKDVDALGFKLPDVGGDFKIKMNAANTHASPVYLRFNSSNDTKAELKYNRESVSPTNTWDAGEVISVYYDGTYYQASNAQGGGGKFGSGEKVKDVGITDDVTVNDDNLVTSGGVYKDTPSNVPSTNDCDLDFADSLGNVLVSFEGGHVKTKEFDSTVDAPTKNGTAQYGDLELADPEGNVVVSFENGHIKTKNFDSSDTQNNPWKGKKIIWNGHSGIYGSLVTDRTKIFPYLVNQALDASYVNYAIGGATLSKQPDSYEEMFLSTSEWQAAIAGGLVNTSKQYLVKDGETGSARPFGLYSYSNGAWSALPAGQRTGHNTARTPLVDSISDMDTDADLVIIGIGANDWSNEWTELSSPYVNGVLNDDKETICGAMNIVCQYLSDTYIQNGKRVLFLTECPSFHYIEADNIVSPYSTKLNMTYRQFVDLLTEIAGNYGIPYWNLQEQVGLSSYDTWWVSDGDLAAGRKSHPNVAGHARVAEILTKMILNM